MLTAKKAIAFGTKVAKSPITAKAVHIARTGADIANIAGVPFSGAVAKGLSVAEKVLSAVNKTD